MSPCHLCWTTRACRLGLCIVVTHIYETGADIGYADLLVVFELDLDDAVPLQTYHLLCTIGPGDELLEGCIGGVEQQYPVLKAGGKYAV